jgi:hypothetical protein
MHGENNFCLQQDSASSHKAKRTQKWSGNNLPDFFTPSDYPASSLDLNPLDYFAWEYILDKFDCTMLMTLA